ncbi:hypothetical protein DMN91_010579 [Ooceraea biroi]|uniref:Uncharacterized protein n=1 Tax=Ooceraea biroi TaxID=2015173 RepID=A0A3L8D8A6_OOCBI|nr:hypothetical protein DMN91_010579 [Ooceraea biroi]
MLHEFEIQCDGIFEPSQAVCLIQNYYNPAQESVKAFNISLLEINKTVHVPSPFLCFLVFARHFSRFPRHFVN